MNSNINNLNNIALCDVTVVIAVSDKGDVDCHVYDDNTSVLDMNSYKVWLENKRKDDRLWTIKTIFASVPLPVQVEDFRSENSSNAGSGVSVK